MFEASAKTGHGVESSFIALTDALIDKAEEKIKNNPQQIPQNQLQSNDIGVSSTNSEQYYQQEIDPNYQNPYQNNIKVKKINRGGLSQTDKALMMCC